MVTSIPETISQATCRTPLGINAKLSAIQSPGGSQPIQGPERARLHRLERFAIQREAKSLLGWKRLNECMVAPILSTVNVMLSTEHQAAHYKGLATCGSVWVCSVCAAKVSERRRAELNRAISAWRDQEGGSVLLLTLTFPHKANDPLKPMLEAFQNARQKLRADRAYKAFLQRLGVEGTIASLEVTHGENGWHPHVHILLFSDWSEDERAIALSENPELLEEYKSCVYRAWKRVCERAGLPTPSEAHGVDIRDGSYAADYAAKWGMASELTKAHLKRGRKGSRTPWDLLRSSLYEDDDQAGELFKDYAYAFRGRKQLHWSKGLRDKLGLGQELTDEEVSEQTLEPSTLLAQLSRDEWRLVVRYRFQEALLTIAETEGLIGIQRFLEYLKTLGSLPRAATT